MDADRGWAVGQYGTILHYVGPPNEPPSGFIDSITPNPALEGDVVSFFGHGTDTDGMIISYNWQSSISEQLSSQALFSTDTLPAGEHVICFKVMDDYNVWSSEVCDTLRIIAAPLVVPEDLVIRVDTVHVRLNWSPVRTAQEYKVFSDSLYTGEFNTLIATVADTFFVDSNQVLQPRVRQFYLIRAVRP